MLKYAGAQLEGGEVNGQRSAHMYKKPRRRTIYVPSDDTSILTIHPGSKLEAGIVNDSVLALNSSSFKRRKALGTAATARRAPLQPSLKPLQENGFNVDMVGARSGKENLPPNGFDAKMAKAKNPGSERVSTSVTVPHILPDSLVECHRCGAEDRTPNSASMFHRFRPGSRQPYLSRRNPREDPADASTLDRRKVNYHGPDRKVPAIPGLDTVILNSQSKPPDSVLSQDIVTQGQQDLIASENTTVQPGEATWLDHQEIVIQQSVNEVFDATREGKTTSCSPLEEIKKSLLRIYHDIECSTLYDKIQASLEFGALSPPNRASTEISRLRHDLKLRQRFVATWIESYDLETLHAAAEVVTRREINICLPNTSRGGQQYRGSSKTLRKEIQILIDSYLLRNEDVFGHQQTLSIWCWRRTVSRSLMMILLMARILSVS